MDNVLQQWVALSLGGERLSDEDALSILRSNGPDILSLVEAAGQVRRHYFGRKVRLHQIHNIQNGLCPEDCGYCGQAKGSQQPLKRYLIKPDEEILAEARAAKDRGVFRYCMVASGRGPNEVQTEQLCRVVRRITDEVGIRTCLSVGLVDEVQAHRFKEAGLDRLNHNLNTSETHTPQVVTTHTFSDRMKTLRAAERAGLSTCSGMIAGMGETDRDILEVALTLREMKVPSIPINFLVPIEGNRLYASGQLTPERCLRILCLFRFLNPSAEVRVGGGREGHLRGMQGLALYPANSIFVEGYLVTRGDGFDAVRAMVEDAGFELEGESAGGACCTSGIRFRIDGDTNIMRPETVVRN